MDKMIETGLAKGSIVPWELHDRFCFALRAIHIAVDHTSSSG
jgi:hypothetical protein